MRSNWPGQVLSGVLGIGLLAPKIFMRPLALPDCALARRRQRVGARHGAAARLVGRRAHRHRAVDLAHAVHLVAARDGPLFRRPVGRLAGHRHGAGGAVETRIVPLDTEGLGRHTAGDAGGCSLARGVASSNATAAASAGFAGNVATGDARGCEIGRPCHGRPTDRLQRRWPATRARNSSGMPTSRGPGTSVKASPLRRRPGTRTAR